MLASTGRGNLKLDCLNAQGEVCGITLLEVLIVPKLGVNLFSARKASMRGASVIFNEDGSYIQLGEDEYPIKHEKGLCLWKCRVQGEEDSSFEGAEDPAAYAASAK